MALITRRQFSRDLLVLATAAAFPGSVAAWAGASSEVTAVDTHSHIFRRGLPLALVHRYVPNYDATLEEYLKQLDAQGMSHGVLVQPSFLGTNNDFLVQAVRSNPERLRGICVVEPTIAKTELAELAKGGFVGIRLNLIGERIPDLSSPTWTTFLGLLSDLDWQVEIQREAQDLPGIMRGLLERKVNVVIDHFGRPDPKLGVKDPGFEYLLSSAGSGKVWVKLSGAYRNGNNGLGEQIALEAAPMLLKAFGPERLVWGSDWPHTQFESTASYSAARADLEKWVPDAAARARILSETPAKLFKF